VHQEIMRPVGGRGLCFHFPSVLWHGWLGDSNQPIKHDTQLLQRDHVMHYVSWNLVNCCTLYKKLHLKMLEIGFISSELASYSNSLKIKPSDRPNINPY